MFWKKAPTDKRHLQNLESKINSLTLKLKEIEKIQNHIVDFMVGLDEMINNWKEGLK